MLVELALCAALLSPSCIAMASSSQIARRVNGDASLVLKVTCSCMPRLGA